MLKTIRTMMKLYVLQRAKEAAQEAEAKKKQLDAQLRKVKYSRILRKYKYIHVMNNGLHSEAIIRFLNHHFDRREHCFIFPYMKTETVKKVNDIGNAFNAPLEAINVATVDKIIFHGLFTRLFIDFLFQSEEALAKSYWFIWGGDLYCEDDDVARYVKANVRGVLTAFDRDVYRERFGDNTFFDITYPNAMTDDLVAGVPEKGPDAPLHILINNCTDDTTEGILEQLARFADRNIRISTILSYVTVGQSDVKERIKAKGEVLFGEKFTPVEDFLPLEEYARFLASVDIYISNQDRQQGNGNASFLCSLGKKIFTKSDTSVYKLYNSLGIRYFDTYTIPDLTFEELVAYDDETKARSVESIRRRMADAEKVRQWRELFDWNPAADAAKEDGHAA